MKREFRRAIGAVPSDSADVMYRGINQVRRLVNEIDEYLFPASVEAKTEDPGSVLAAIIQSRLKEMAAHGIRMGVTLKDSLTLIHIS